MVRDSAHPPGRLPFPPERVEELIREGQLKKLLKNYEPSKLSQTLKQQGKGSKPSNVVVTKLLDTHILCGRGNCISTHPGNEFFRKLVLSNQPHYNNMSRGMKKIAADALLGYFESIGMVFIEGIERQTKRICPEGYVQSSYARVNEKIMQALRQKLKRPKVGLPQQVDAEKVNTEVDNDALSESIEKESALLQTGYRPSIKKKVLAKKKGQKEKKAAGVKSAPVKVKKMVKPTTKKGTEKPAVKTEKPAPKFTTRRASQGKSTGSKSGNSSLGRARFQKKSKAQPAEASPKSTMHVEDVDGSQCSPRAVSEESVPIVLEGIFEEAKPAQVATLAAFLLAKMKHSH